MSYFNQNSVEKSDQEVMKHVCKLCSKSFPCGRSLGGHMRSHVINSTEKMKLSSLNNNGGNIIDNRNVLAIDVSSNSSDLGYELRKDPKKSIKANDLVVLDKLCKECGKGFQSWKALFGHMKCHSDKISNTKTAVWNQGSMVSRSENESPGAKRSQMKKSRSRNGTTKRCIVTCPLTPTITTTTNTTAATVATASSSVSMNANNTSTSVVSDVDHDQEAEIAMCLIMLSRDVGKWGKKIIGNGCKMEKLAETDDVGLEKTSIDRDEFDYQSKRKFECTTCNKSFQTYQALGGHRASHKKLKGCFDSENDDKNMIKTEPMLDYGHMLNGYSEIPPENHRSSSSFNLGGSLKNTMVVGVHECSICSRIFSSGQALGGHKRSHLIAEAKQNQQNPNSIEKFNNPVHEIRGFLDLNMPPDPVEDEQEQQETITGYNPWCYNHESTLLGLLSTS